MNDQHQQFFATAARGIEPLLVTELSRLGGHQPKEELGGVAFSGSLEVAYRACLWSRLASRVLLPLARFTADDDDQLYRAVRDLDWAQHLGPSSTLAVDCTSFRSPLNHSRFAALRVKDAIVDQFRERYDQRPSVDVRNPDIRLNLYLHRERAILSLDLSGEALHRRGYRSDAGEAPLKENLAAAILVRANWPEVCAAGGGLLDPLCGSGTLVLEAALLATDTAPGLLRTDFGFLGWRQHAAGVWQQLLDEAEERRQQGRVQRVPPIVGYDSDRRAVSSAWDQAARVGLESLVHFERRTLQDFQPPSGETPGLLVTNPPYGERLGRVDQLPALYNLLGAKLASCLPGWRAAVLTSDSQLGRSIGLRADKINRLYNGALKCQLLQFHLTPDNHWKSLAAGAGQAVKKSLSSGAEMFANRLRKNLKKYRPWARREKLEGYRLYDADLPEYAFAIDIYADQVHLQEYRAPKTVAEKKAAMRRDDVLAVLPQVLDVDEQNIHQKLREQQKGRHQYQKQSGQGVLHEVGEGDCRFLVNLDDYLDTGLFLDHRLTRGLIRDLAPGRRFLNLFAYTATATVYALKGGAVSTTSVDLSRTYLEWAQKNLVLNGFQPNRQELIQADCLAWLSAEQNRRAGRFELIFLDPPTFSNSKSMAESFDIQRDHGDLLRSTTQLLAPGGTLIFSTNRRRFKLDQSALAGFTIEDISARTLPYDFQRNPRIHSCWQMTRELS